MEGLVFRAFIEIVALGIFIQDLDALFLVQGADGVRADAEAFFYLALDGLGGGEDGRGFRPVRVLSASRPWVANKQTAGGHFNAAVHAGRTVHSFNRMRAGKSERSWRSGSTSSRVV